MLAPAARHGAVAAIACVALLTGGVPSAALASPTWLAPSDLSASGQNAFAPQVAIDLQGDALAAWERYDGANYIIQASLRPASSGAWLAPVDLSTTGRNALNAQVALNPRGDAVVVWEGSDGTNSIIQAAVRPVATGQWGAAVDLSAGGQNAHGPQVGLDPQGNAVAVWYRPNGSVNIVQATTRPAVSGVWQSPVDLSAGGQNALSPQVAVDPQGNAVAVWTRFNGSDYIIQSAARTGATGVWQAPVDLSATGGSAEAPDIAIDPQGNAIAVWSRFGATNSIIQSAARPISSVWQSPVDLSAAGQNAGLARVGVGAQGDAVATWMRNNGSNSIAQAAARPASSGVWQAAVDLSVAGQNAMLPQVAVDPQGDAAVVWERFNGANGIVQAAGYDAAGPLLRSVAVPSSGSAGQSLPFSVSPLDVWSAVASTSWSFGDGTSAIGSSVVHAYSAPGSYNVTLTSADLLGNASSTSGSVAISSSPPPLPASKPGPPRLSSVSISNRRFRVARSPTAVLARKAPRGTSFRFTLSAAAKVQITITRSATGLRRGRICVAPTRRLRRVHARRCTRTVIVGVLTRISEPRGPDRIAFSGRIGRRALNPGKYRALLSASNATGRSSTVALAFTVVR